MGLPVCVEGIAGEPEIYLFLLKTKLNRRVLHHFRSGVEATFAALLLESPTSRVSEDEKVS